MRRRPAPVARGWKAAPRATPVKAAARAAAGGSGRARPAANWELAEPTLLNRENRFARRGRFPDLGGGKATDDAAPRPAGIGGNRRTKRPPRASVMGTLAAPGRAALIHSGSADIVAVGGPGGPQSEVWAPWAVADVADAVAQCTPFHTCAGPARRRDSEAMATSRNSTTSGTAECWSSSVEDANEADRNRSRWCVTTIRFEHRERRQLRRQETWTEADIPPKAPADDLRSIAAGPPPAAVGKAPLPQSPRVTGSGPANARAAGSGLQTRFCGRGGSVQVEQPDRGGRNPETPPLRVAAGWGLGKGLRDRSLEPEKRTVPKWRRRAADGRPERAGKPRTRRTKKRPAARSGRALKAPEVTEARSGVTSGPASRRPCRGPASGSGRRPGRRCARAGCGPKGSAPGVIGLSAGAACACPGRAGPPPRSCSRFSRASWRSRRWTSLRSSLKPRSTVVMSRDTAAMPPRASSVCAQNSLWSSLSVDAGGT